MLIFFVELLIYKNCWPILQNKLLLIFQANFKSNKFAIYVLLTLTNDEWNISTDPYDDWNLLNDLKLKQSPGYDCISVCPPREGAYFPVKY